MCGGGGVPGGRGTRNAGGEGVKNTHGRRTLGGNCLSRWWRKKKRGGGPVSKQTSTVGGDGSPHIQNVHGTFYHSKG